MKEEEILRAARDAVHNTGLEITSSRQPGQLTVIVVYLIHRGVAGACGVISSAQFCETNEHLTPDSVKYSIHRAIGEMLNHYRGLLNDLSQVRR